MIAGEDRLAPSDRASVANYWWRRAEGELTSWVAFGHVLDDLRAEGAPDAVIALAERSVADELRHSEWCQDWAVRFGHAPGIVKPRSQKALCFPDAEPADNRVLRIAFCCFTETVGCFVLRHARPSLVDDALRKLNRRHAADELQHSRVGWAYLSTLDARRRDLLSRWLPILTSALAETCCEGQERACEELVPFGYFTPRLLREAHESALRAVIVPGLAHLGIRGFS